MDLRLTLLVGVALSVILTAGLVMGINIAGMTFGQRCKTEARQGEHKKNCVPRLSGAKGDA
ncbi:hypothetical protein D0839_15390 [Bordetella avium]|nr:hypothetical protein D0839_15390 [Bordetella avium]